MNEENINEFQLIDRIGQTKDVDRLFKLSDSSAFSIASHQILVSLYDANPKSLNKH